MKDIFIILFYLGCGLDLYVAYPQQTHYSKHQKSKKKHKLKRGKWKIPKDIDYRDLNKTRH